MIKKPIGSFLINVFALYATSQLVSGLVLGNENYALFLVAGGLTIIHLLLKPLLDLVFRSLNLVTLGLVGLVIDAVILYSVSLYFPQIKISSWQFPGIIVSDLTIQPRFFGPLETTVISALAMGVIRLILNIIFY